MAAYVQSASTGTSGASTTIAKAFGSNVTAANLLLAYAYWNSNSQTCSVADGVNTWSAVGSPLTGVGTLSGYRSQLFYAPNAAAGATTVTATFSASNTDRGLAIHEASAVGQLDVSGYANYSGTTPALSASLTASDATARYWFGGAVMAITSDGTAAGGFTRREWTNFVGNATTDEVASTAAAQQCQFGLSGGTQAVMTVLAAFSAAGGGGNVFSWFK